MKGRVAVLITVVVLLGAAGVVVGLLAKHDPGNRESVPSAPTEDTTTPTEDTTTPVPEETTVSEETTISGQPDSDEALRLVRSRAEKYIAAINARDEPSAAHYTCRKKDASLLWVVAAGRKITLLDVDGPFPPGHAFGQLPWWSAGAGIRIEGRPSSKSITFVLKDGEWCVYP